MWFTQENGFEEIDRLSAINKPFLFVISYNKRKVFVSTLETLDKDIFYKIEKQSNSIDRKRDKKFLFKKFPITFNLYQKHLNRVIEEIKKGNTYLLNLTFQTKIETDLSLKEIYDYAKSPFKLYFKDEFVCFSPEKFVEIDEKKISTFPMKGTKDAMLFDAKNKLKEDSKELAEHTMIVDLMRNDLAIISNKVRVKSFRYMQEIEAGEKRLLQTSSHIEGERREDLQIGEILDAILPAGSITGTPKKKTVEIIEEIENFERGFYTGVFGIYQNKKLNSAVMIRFIEKKEEQLYYKSGGGITLNSDTQKEYQEMIDKIYLPF